MKPLPLRVTLTAAFTALLALVVTALAVGFHASLVRQLESDTTQELEEKARALHGYLQFPNGVPTLVYDRSDVEESVFVADATRFYQVYDAGTGRLLAQSPALEALGLHYTPEEVREFRANPGVLEVQTDRGRLRLLSSVISPAQGGVFVVQIGDLLDRVDAALASFDRLLFWRILSGLVASGIAGWLLTRWALAPLLRLAEATHAIDINNLNQRLVVRGGNDELDEVTAAFNRALERVDDAVGEMRQFSTALAHELRTPLAILRGEAELAMRTLTSVEDFRQQLASQVEEFDRLTRLINQILTLARAEAGEIRLADEPVDLTALVTSVAEQIELIAAARHIVFTVDARSAIWVRGDQGWLERLLLLLLDNAIKYTPEGGRVSAALGRADGVATVRIQDTGIGIAADALPRLFQRFYRAAPARSHQAAPGAGLGLALAQWIAERHQATINVTSQPGEGSTFTLRLPALGERDAIPPKG